MYLTNKGKFVNEDYLKEIVPDNGNIIVAVVREGNIYEMRSEFDSAAELNKAVDKLKADGFDQVIYHAEKTKPDKSVS